MKSIKHIAIVVIVFFATSFLQSQNCMVPDNGTGTATLPPIGCHYESVDPFMIIDGLPPGTTMELAGYYSEFVCCDGTCPLCSLAIPPGECEVPGGSLGGDGHCFMGTMVFDVVGTGDLTGFNRTLIVDVFSEIHTAPRIPGDPVQTFTADYYRLDGALFGDPDFCTFHITAGTSLGLPSPGQTTLTQLPSGDFEVDSFFDITYQIEFEGCPGSALEGLMGITTATTRFEIPFVAENEMIDPGPDFWTAPGASIPFGGVDMPAIPADFFGPGSDPFEGQINFEGGAIDPLPFPDFHARIERLTPASVPLPYPAWATIDVEIVQLNLVSTVPITITYDGGLIEEDWFVEVGLSVIPPTTGYMDLIKEDTYGGIFSYMPLNIQPLFTFSLASDLNEKRTWDTGLEGISPLEFTSDINDYPWQHSPIGNDFNATADYPMPLTTSSGESTLELLPYLLRQDDFWVEMGMYGFFQFGGGSGYNDGEWYEYPNYNWWNIWFYDHPFDSDRTKAMNVSFLLDKLDPGEASYATIVINWSTGAWSAEDIPTPPLPENVPTQPLEDLYIVRSEPLYNGPVDGPIPIDQYFYEILEYNPEWISIDVRGYNFVINNGNIDHVCLQKDILYDWGDAPDSPGLPQYPTLAVNYGANHVIDNVTYLGASIDAENDGIPDAMALGDDNSNFDDEDGVIFPATLVIGQSNTIDVIASVDGYLNAWIDFDNDGNWINPNDQIFFDENLVAGINSITFNVPASAAAGLTFARFRFDSSGGLDYDGPAPNGEVEDYEIELTGGDIFKWQQLPDLSFFGMDVDATNDLEGNEPPHILADDFECTMTGSITNITIWGSWFQDRYPWYEAYDDVIFTLSIHADIPDGGGGYSMPGEVLWWRVFQPGEFYVENYAFGLEEGWFDPASGYFDPFGDTECWMYSFDIDTDNFIQMGTPASPVVYWLDVQAQPTDPEPECRFGWKTSETHWNDDGVWGIGEEPYGGFWNELVYPPEHELQGQSIDLAFRITGEEGQEQIDWGDAPDDLQIPQYPTLAVNGGASHIVDNVTYLGAAIDGESDGIPDPNSLGDDNDNIDDEDGVIFTSSLIPGFNATVDVTASVSGYLNAWIDFEVDGGWGEAIDQIFMDQALVPGINHLNFNVPTNAITGNTFARFRFSTIAGITFTGQIPDGEVEDYEVNIENTPSKWWTQIPDLSDLGLDVDATAFAPADVPFNILADDFQCTQTGPITTISIWGSWYHDHYPWFENPADVVFTLSIHADIPAEESPTGYSMPGDVLWFTSFAPGSFSAELFAAGLFEGWYDPAIPMYEQFGDTQCWKYTFNPNEAEVFIQEGTPDEPIVYWLDVQAQPLDSDPECRFGWKTSPDHWNDDAVWTEGMEPYNGFWNELVYPVGHPLEGQSIDLAFEIYGQENPYILVDLHAILEGPYNGTDMSTMLNDAGSLPLSQPYSIAPWSYAGTESVTGIPNSDVVDWVLVELRETLGGPASADPSKMIAQKASFLLKDNSIVALDGTSYLKFYRTITSNLFMVIWHRNHLGVMSANPVIPISGVYTYDFTIPAGQAYLDGQKDVGSGIYGMYGGNGNSDGIININDKTLWMNDAGNADYKAVDYNLDTQVDNKDKDDIWVPNVGVGTKVPN
jgi:hypothetical protein